MKKSTNWSLRPLTLPAGARYIAETVIDWALFRERFGPSLCAGSYDGAMLCELAGNSPACPHHRRRAALVTLPSDDRSPLAKAYGWAARIMIVSLEMVLPGLAGYWLDQRLGTLPLLMLLGFALGGIAAMAHLLQMTRSPDRRR